MHRSQQSPIAILMFAFISFCTLPTLVVADEPIAALSSAQVVEQFGRFDPARLRQAIVDLQNDFGSEYPEADSFLADLDSIETETPVLKSRVRSGDSDAVSRARENLLFQRKALTANPLLRDAELLMIRRHVGPTARQLKDTELSKFGNGINLGLPWRNAHSNLTIADARNAWDDEIVALSNLGSAQPTRRLIYAPRDGRIMIDMDLDFDGRRIMYSAIGAHDRWHIFETDATGKTPVQLTPSGCEAVDFFDSCYLPDGRVILMGTGQFNGLPCEGGSTPVGMPYLLNPTNGDLRQLGFDQETSWHPSVKNDGRVMYLRYEYTDGAPHYFSRLVFHMNPDGTDQRAIYGSNSYWPNCIYFPRAVPNHPTKFVGVVSGHHGNSRMGKMILFDTALGQHETEGVVQVIPRPDETIEPIFVDRLYNNTEDTTLFPYPLSDKYFLVTMKPKQNSLFGVYLVDIFGNATLLYEEEDHILIDPMPLASRECPPTIPDRIDLAQDEATVVLQDIYLGPGLAGVPRGTVKRLRIFGYNYSPTYTGGHDDVGIESGWDVKVLLGTVPVEEDGSALFNVPANTPFAIQPLDADGAALQLMRSWMVGMPGERLSCVGCHETIQDAPPGRPSTAMYRDPSPIEPCGGPVRPFGFLNEIQPLLDLRCVGCHDGQTPGPNGEPAPQDLRHRPQGRFGSSYAYLQQFIRRPGPETDYHLLRPMEFHAGTSELIQILKAGHYGVTLENAEWESLYAWIDLNVPFHGSVIEKCGGVCGDHWWKHDIQFVNMPGQNQILGAEDWREGVDLMLARRMELLSLYADVSYNPEDVYENWSRQVAARYPIESIVPEFVGNTFKTNYPDLEGAFDSEEALRLQESLGETRMSIPLGSERSIEMVRIPSGRFINSDGTGDAIVVERPFWMSVNEISNEQFAYFDPAHDSRYIDLSGKDQTSPGIAANRPEQPVVRISYDQADAFCRWLGRQAERDVQLPTESQWEWAARSGTTTPFYFGDLDADFSPHANLADPHNKKMTAYPKVEGADGQAVAEQCGAYRPNAWGLYDMHGNVAEWTRPDVASGGVGSDQFRTARGGSWRDRPHRATASFRIEYARYQPVFNVGFRIIIEE
jgi:formylglycine-generating enzyme required for sulfatase activity